MFAFPSLLFVFYRFRFLLLNSEAIFYARLVEVSEKKTKVNVREICFIIHGDGCASPHSTVTFRSKMKQHERETILIGD